MEQRKPLCLASASTKFVSTLSHNIAGEYTVGNLKSLSRIKKRAGITSKWQYARKYSRNYGNEY